MKSIHLSVTVNRQARGISIEPETTLLEALRDGLSLTGTKKGCDRGECGPRTVHVDDRWILSRMTLAAMQEGKRIATIRAWSKKEASARSRRPSSTATASNAASARIWKLRHALRLSLRRGCLPHPDSYVGLAQCAPTKKPSPVLGSQIEVAPVFRPNVVGQSILSSLLGNDPDHKRPNTGEIKWSA
jgi:hypothetical protein